MSSSTSSAAKGSKVDFWCPCCPPLFFLEGFLELGIRLFLWMGVLLTGRELLLLSILSFACSLATSCWSSSFCFKSLIFFSYFNVVFRFEPREFLFGKVVLHDKLIMFEM